MEYDFKHIESKWQEKWEEEGVFHAVDNSDKPKFYGLVEFPYPSRYARRSHQGVFGS